MNLPVAEIYEMSHEKIDAIGCSAESVRKGDGPWNKIDSVILRVVDE